MKALDTIRRNIVAAIPGTALNVAQAKRRMERQLRADGYSRKESMTLASKHFQKQSNLQSQ